MMSILTRPRPPRSDLPADAEALEALIEEARERARRRRRGYAACTLVAAAVGLLAFYGFNHGGGATRPQAHAGQPQGEVGVGSRVGYGRWISAPGPYDGISELVFDPQHPSTVFAGTGMGVYRSADGGRSWRALDLAPGPGANRVDALAIAHGDSKTLYAGTGAGVFKTTDGGASWRAVNSGLFGEETAAEREHRSLEGYVGELAIDPRDPDVVYAATWENGLFKSTDGGRSWRSLGLKGALTVALDATSPEIVYAGAGGPPGGVWKHGVFKSTDGGASWRPIGLQRPIGHQGSGVTALAVDPEQPTNVFAGTYRTGIFKSTDGGASWRPAGLAGKSVGGHDPLLLDPQDPQTVYAEWWENDVNGVSKSSDGGRTWQALTIGREAELLALHPRNSTRLYADSDIGILTSSDGGRSWRATGWGPSNGSVSTLAVAPGQAGTAYAGVDHGGVFKRGSDGSWRAANTGLRNLGVHTLAVDPRAPANVYAGTDAGVFKSTDGGQSWQRVRAARGRERSISALAVDPRHPHVVYAIAAEHGVFKSTDAGTTWRALEGGFGTSDDIGALALNPRNPEILYLGGVGLFKSKDGGTTWRTAGLTGTTVYEIAVDPEEPATLYAGTDAGLFTSTDAGASWQVLAGPLDGAHVEAVAIDPQRRRSVYAGTDSGVFKSANGGRSWRRFTHLPVRTFDALALDPTAGLVYAGAYGGGIYELAPGRVRRSER
jgi:photosystem II stability/assembly factor-like uncharacterized protein